jgi:hypothetical protein
MKNLLALGLVAYLSTHPTQARNLGHLTLVACGLFAHLCAAHGVVLPLSSHWN